MTEPGADLGGGTNPKALPGPFRPQEAAEEGLAVVGRGCLIGNDHNVFSIVEGVYIAVDAFMIFKAFVCGNTQPYVVEASGAPRLVVLKIVLGRKSSRVFVRGNRGEDRGIPAIQRSQSRRFGIAERW